jgi:hypothetical protein
MKLFFLIALVKTAPSIVLMPVALLILDNR